MILRPNAMYFRLRPEEVSYERMEANKAKKPEGGGGTSPAPDNGGHLGI